MGILSELFGGTTDHGGPAYDWTAEAVRGTARAVPRAIIR